MSNQLDASIAKRFDFIVKQNQTFNPLLTFTDNDGAPISLAGASAKLSVRSTGCNTTCGCDGETPFNLVYKQDFYGTVTGASNNQLQFDDIILLSPDTYKYDLLIEFSSGERQYFLTGNFKVKKSYTQNDN